MLETEWGKKRKKGRPSLSPFPFFNHSRFFLDSESGFPSFFFVWKKGERERVALAPLPGFPTNIFTFHRIMVFFCPSKISSSTSLDLQIGGGC